MPDFNDQKPPKGQDTSERKDRNSQRDKETKDVDVKGQKEKFEEKDKNVGKTVAKVAVGAAVGAGRKAFKTFASGGGLANTAAALVHGAIVGGQKGYKSEDGVKGAAKAAVTSNKGKLAPKDIKAIASEIGGQLNKQNKDALTTGATGQTPPTLKPKGRGIE